jgi:hypothetical protein
MDDIDDTLPVDRDAVVLVVVATLVVKPIFI